MKIPATALVASLTLALASLAPAAPVAAQSAQDAFEVSFQARETERRGAIAKTMRFTDAEAAEFWPIYDQYRLTAKSHQLRRFRMIARLSQNTVGMTPETAKEIMTGALALEDDQQSAKQKYFTKLSPHFEGARYFRLYQLETKLDAIFRHGWTKGIPLAVTDEELEILQDAAEAAMNAAEQKKASNDAV